MSRWHHGGAKKARDGLSGARTGARASRARTRGGWPGLAHGARVVREGREAATTRARGLA